MEAPFKRHTFVVTGGGGYIGYHIAVRLVQLGHVVVLYDLQYPSAKWGCHRSSGERSTLEEIHCQYGSMQFVKGDVRDFDLLLGVTKGVTCIIHTASYGMSGREQMQPFWDKVESININGTRNVVEAGARNQCRGLVYTSTYNVVFGGTAIIDGNEDLPYFPLHRHVDHYSRTKSIAEQLVLAANGRGPLQTCALRLAGVIGRGETRHLPRILTAIRSGWVRFNYFDEHGGLVDFIGIDNVVQGHVKAALELCETGETSSRVGGQAYFLSDGHPVNNLEYFRPLVEHHGRTFPKLRLPMWFMFFLVFLVHHLYCLVYRFFNFTPFLTPAELFKTGVTHYFSIDKARRDFDYAPTRPNDLSDVIAEISKPS